MADDRTPRLPVLTAATPAQCVDLLRRTAKFKREAQAPALRRQEARYRDAGDHAAARDRHDRADLREVEASELESHAAQLEELLRRQADRRRELTEALLAADAADEALT